MITTPFIEELEQEAKATRKMLERVPNDKLGWKPHEKSYTLGQLASHIAEIPNWASITVTTPVLDFSKTPYKMSDFKSSNEMVKGFDEGLKKALDAYKNCSDEEMMKSWQMRDGENVYLDMPRTAVLRSFIMNHLIHHRGQLSVYLRMLDVPLPQVYGPTADEQ